MNNKFIELKPSSIKSTTINIPGSKSISNRVLLLSSLAHGKTIVKNLLQSDDTKIMLLALKKLGIKINFNHKLNQYNITGADNEFPIKNAELFIGNSGTTIRPLTAALAFNNGNYKL